MTSAHFSMMSRARRLEDCITIVRDAVLGRRAATCRTMPEAIEQAAFDLGLSLRSTKGLFYRETLFVRREFWIALKSAAVEECTRRAEMLQERTEVAQAKRRQHQMDLETATCGSCAGLGGDSATGAGNDA
jgi:hypothetical protein